MGGFLTLHTVCESHNVTVPVGPGSLLSEYECPACVAISDDENLWRPCCSAYNTTCCGHDEYADEPSFQVRIDSPNFCDIDHKRDLSDVPF